ncbi:Chromatin structure remodeling complex protein sfh1 [Ascosphaera aggregata]|nr:Chromatin structure remodeling complex protein sfh1 [Ascosphaera aggregata]
MTTSSQKYSTSFQQPIQGYVTSYAPRLRQYANALLQPLLPQQTQAPTVRTTKRGTTVINYAEDGFDEDDFFEESDSSRRQSGYGAAAPAAVTIGGGGGAAAAAAAAGLRNQESPSLRGPAGEKLGIEINEPVKVQPNFREWVVKKPLKPAIDVEVPAHLPIEPFYLPRNYAELGINPHHPAYRKPEPAPPHRIKDAFLWNLHEALITPEEFAVTLIRDLDLPSVPSLAFQVSSQIRSQLEEYAGVALHPLFQSSPTVRKGYSNAPKVATPSSQKDKDATEVTATPTAEDSTSATLDATTIAASATSSSTAANAQQQTQANASTITDSLPEDDELNHDDAYRCIVQLNINLQNKLYTDKFEWSLLHSQAAADSFARVTCADLGLGGEWVSALSHGICESVLKLKKEVCEGGGLISGMNAYGNEIDNQAVNGEEAGWRYDPDGLGYEWEPKLEISTKEEMEKREGDKERQVRRVRRETARFSSTSGLLDTQHSRQSSFSIFDNPDPNEPMGRGERTKKKRRFRSLSPLARAGTPARGTPDATGYGGGGGQLTDWERQTWRCSNCWVYGTGVWAVRDGPAGPRRLCNNCGLLYERMKRLPVWQKNLHHLDLPLPRS